MSNSGMWKTAKVNNITIVGGGSAGYLSAIFFQTHGYRVKLIEPQDIPRLNVGEATTVALPQFLHKDCRIPFARTLRKIKPTLKIGIQFGLNKNNPNYYYHLSDVYKYFNQMGLKYDTRLFLQSFNNKLFSYEDFMCKHRRVPFGETSNGVCGFPTWGYHIQNEKFVPYLKEEAIIKGIEILDDSVEHCTLNPETGDIETAKLKSGKIVGSDLWIDCTGFSAKVIKHYDNKALPVSDQLIVNSAVSVNIPNQEIPRPYTTVDPLTSGWKWGIDHMDKTTSHGYVYCDNLQSEESAIRELEKAVQHPIKDPTVIKFKAQYRKKPWQKNVIAIGNSAGFIEPMESTAIHSHIWCLKYVLYMLHCTGDRPNQGHKDDYNKAFDSLIVNMAEFIEAHYKWATVDHDTEFWKHANNMKIGPAHQHYLDAYKRDGLMEDLDITPPRSDIFKSDGYNTIFWGSGLMPDRPIEIDEKDLKAFWQISQDVESYVINNCLKNEDLFRDGINDLSGVFQ